MAFIFEKLDVYRKAVDFMERVENRSNSYPNFINVSWFQNSAINFMGKVFLTGRFGEFDKKLTNLGKARKSDIIAKIRKIIGD